MIFEETKFAYLHKPTGMWVYIDWHFDDELWDDDKYPCVYDGGAIYVDVNTGFISSF
jgi:hypothetical protein